MRQDGIRAMTVKKWRAATQSNHRLSVAENTLKRQFTVTQPNRYRPETSPTCGPQKAGSTWP